MVKLTWWSGMTCVSLSMGQLSLFSNVASRVYSSASALSLLKQRHRKKNIFHPFFLWWLLTSHCAKPTLTNTQSDLPEPLRSLWADPPPPRPTLRRSHPDVSIVPLRKLLLPSAVFTAGLWFMPASVLVTEIIGLFTWIPGSDQFLCWGHWKERTLLNTSSSLK